MAVFEHKSATKVTLDDTVTLTCSVESAQTIDGHTVSETKHQQLTQVMLKTQNLSLNRPTAMFIMFILGILNSLWPGDAIWSHRSGPSALALAQVMSCWLGDTKAWPEPMMTSHWQIVVKVLRAAKKIFTWVICIWPRAGRGPTGLRARVRNRGRLENQIHVVPKMGFQDGGEVSRWRRPNSDI